MFWVFDSEIGDNCVIGPECILMGGSKVQSKTCLEPLSCAWKMTSVGEERQGEVPMPPVEAAATSSDGGGLGGAQEAEGGEDVEQGQKMKNAGLRKRKTSAVTGTGGNAGFYYHGHPPVPTKGKRICFSVSAEGK